MVHIGYTETVTCCYKHACMLELCGAGLSYLRKQQSNIAACARSFWGNQVATDNACSADPNEQYEQYEHYSTTPPPPRQRQRLLQLLLPVPVPVLVSPSLALVLVLLLLQLLLPLLQLLLLLLLQQYWY